MIYYLSYIRNGGQFMHTFLIVLLIID
ncbi:preprotein translocase subunit SecG, partial [Staphylococcus aureus]